MHGSGVKSSGLETRLGLTRPKYQLILPLTYYVTLDKSLPLSQFPFPFPPFIGLVYTDKLFWAVTTSQ